MKRIPKETFYSLILRTIIFMFISAILGSMTYTRLDLIITTIYIAFYALILYFPPIYNFFPQLQNLPTIKTAHLPTIISIIIFILTYIILYTFF